MSISIPINSHQLAVNRVNNNPIHWRVGSQKRKVWYSSIFTVKNDSQSHRNANVAIYQNMLVGFYVDGLSCMDVTNLNTPIENPTSILWQLARFAYIRVYI